MTRGIPNGRTRRVREYLVRVKEARSPAQILRAVEPGGCLQALNNTIAQMVRRGYLEQLGRGRGQVRYRTGQVALPDARVASARKREHSIAVQTTRPRNPRTNFTAAPGTVVDPKRAASDRIAADIAAFHRRGGRIQKLGVTKLFHGTGDDDEG